jgi:hypothetical protein
VKAAHIVFITLWEPGRDCALHGLVKRVDA